MPLLHMHGTDDEVVPYEGGVVSLLGVEQKVPFPSVMNVVRDWAKNNGGKEIGPEKVLEDISANDGPGNDSSTVSFFRFRDCKHYTGRSGKEIAAEVVYFRINGGGHAWPVLEPDRKASIAALTKTLGKAMVAHGGAINSDISASEEIWKFFRRHELPAAR